MARLQVLHLPGAPEENRFALVLDDVTPEQVEMLNPVPDLSGSGAAATFVFGFPVEIL